ncbi:hypothetical protein FI667_g192, partial [Globisporangium splendens]
MGKHELGFVVFLLMHEAVQQALGYKLYHGEKQREGGLGNASEPGKPMSVHWVDVISITGARRKWSPRTSSNAAPMTTQQHGAESVITNDDLRMRRWRLSNEVAALLKHQERQDPIDHKRAHQEPQAMIPSFLGRFQWDRVRHEHCEKVQKRRESDMRERTRYVRGADERCELVHAFHRVPTTTKEIGSLTPPVRNTLSATSSLPMEPRA